MSSRSAPAAKVARHARPHAAGRPAKAGEQSTSERAMLVAREVERKLSEGCSDILTVEALQAWMAAACKLYAAQIESGQQILPVQERSGVTATDVMTTASGLLRAVNLAVFELGMWQSWSGR
jgi:hypothetical protein